MADYSMQEMVDVWKPENRLEIADSIRANPCEWVKHLWGAELWRGEGKSPGQAGLVESVFGPDKLIACRTGHGIGKTFAMPIITVLWLLERYLRFGENTESAVIITGAAWPSVEKIFMSLAAVTGRCLFPLPTPTADSWRITNTCYARGLSPTRVEAFQGWHYAHGTLVLVDEASDLLHEMFEAMLSCTTGGHDKMLLLGNPIRTDGPFVTALKSSDWKRMHVSSLDTPNVKEGKEVVPGLTTVQWVEKMRREYGEGSAVWNSRVLGEIPDQDIEAFISYSEIHACAERPMLAAQKDTNLTLGVDVARSAAGDQTVLYVRGDRCIHHREAHRGWEQGLIQERIKTLRAKYNISPRRIFIDGTGIGSGLCDVLTTDEGYPESCRVKNGAVAHDQNAYANRKSESWGNMKAGLKTMAIPRDMIRHVEEIATVHYSINSKGQIVIEPKDKYRDRNNKSPDDAEALALTFAQEVGRPAFPCVSDPHRMPRRPRIVNVSRDGRLTPIVTFEGLPLSAGSPGTLARIIWFARHDESACIWVHIDTDNTWIVYDSLRMHHTPVPTFYRKVIEQQPEGPFEYDMYSAQDGSEKRGLASIPNILIKVSMDMRHEFIPGPLNCSVLNSRTGLDYLDSLLLSSLSRFEHDRYWATEPNRLDYMNEKQIYFWPEDVYDAVKYARIPSDSNWASDYDEEEDEGLIGGGGPLIRCLRLLASQVGY